MANSGWPAGPMTLDEARWLAERHQGDADGLCRTCSPGGLVRHPCVDYQVAQARRARYGDPTLEAPDPPAAEPDEATTGGGAHRER